MQTLSFECKKDVMRQTTDGIWKLTLTLNPVDVSPELVMASMGQQFMCVMAPVDGGMPITIEGKKSKRSWHTLSLAEQAGILCSKPEFKSWVGKEDPADYIRALCGVKSRAELKEGTAAGKSFQQLVAKFLHDSNFNMEEYNV